MLCQPSTVVVIIIVVIVVVIVVVVIIIVVIVVIVFIVAPLNVSVETKIKIWRSKIPFMIVVIEMAMKVQRNKWQMKQ